MTTPIIWKPDPPPAGRYRSFFKRGWPTGWSNDEHAHPIVTFTCADEYLFARAKVGNHAPLKIRVALRNDEAVREKCGAFTWRTLKGEWATLAEAKAAATAFYVMHPEMFIQGAV